MTGEAVPRSYPFDPDGEAGTSPVYARYRREQPIVRVRMPYGEPAWLATRHADVKMVHSDPRFSRALAGERDQPRAFPVMPDDNLQGMDPPEHGRLRRLAARVFTAHRVARMRPLIQQITDDLLDRMAQAGPPWDLVEDFAAPLTSGVIAELYGVPPAERPQFAEWAKAQTATTSMSPEQIEDHVGRLQQWVADMVTKRLREPDDDLVGVLVDGYRQAPEISEHEVVTLARLMLAAGHDSVKYQLGHCAYLLLTHPAQLARLVADRTLISSAVEELLRYGKTDEAAVFARYATEDLELSGVPIRAGEPVIPSRISANHDERVFDDPDRLDIGRRHNPHLAFGFGPHHCPGANLARSELQIGLGGLVARFPTLRLAVPASELTWQNGGLARELVSLPVVW
ncbi:cytochrome P450 [Micromonospora echinofusca]|uniref:Cytochrome P450 n=1 Tax=Micromonospora echinofusca TaxID=47858 RepID=A0ABS3VP09_MICEH|nr:cytochrome P450 [Micromonospora echinofusca]MBO4206267.1 cytochrome P450 [Micromonospora echinofusca]